MKLGEFNGKNIRVTLLTGKVIQGKAYDYISALDNTPGIASITIDHIEIFETEIRSIELL